MLALRETLVQYSEKHKRIKLKSVPDSIIFILNTTKISTLKNTSSRTTKKIIISIQSTIAVKMNSIQYWRSNLAKNLITHQSNFIEQLTAKVTTTWRRRDSFKNTVSIQQARLKSVRKISAYRFHCGLLSPIPYRQENKWIFLMNNMMYVILYYI